MLDLLQVILCIGEDASGSISMPVPTSGGWRISLSKSEGSLLLLLLGIVVLEVLEFRDDDLVVFT